MYKISHVQVYVMPHPVDCSTLYFCIKHCDCLVIGGGLAHVKGHV